MKSAGEQSEGQNDSGEHPPGSFLRRLGGWHQLLFWLLGLALAGSAARGYSSTLSEHGNDLSIYLEAARAVLHGHSPMGVDGYIYLPVFAVLLAPLAALPPWLGAFLWQALAWVCILWSARAVARLVKTDRPQPWLPWFCLLATFRLLDSNLSYGQANAFTLAAMLKALSWARDGRPKLAGCLTGGAAAFKILPAVLLGVFLLERRWRSFLLGSALFCALAWLLPLAVLGSDLTLQAHRDWYLHTVRPYQLGGAALFEAFPYVPGQSLVPVVYHTLCDSQISASLPALRANLVNWDPDDVANIVRVLVLLHGAVLAFVIVRDRRRRSSCDLIEHAALAICTVVLVAPLIHRAHMLWIMLPVVLLAARSHQSRLPLKLILALILGLIGLTTSALIGKPASRWLIAHGVVWLAVEGLWLTLVLFMSSPERPSWPENTAPARKLESSGLS